MTAYNQIKKYLLAKQKEVTNKLRSLDEEESLSLNFAPESLELGSFSWEADTNSTKMAIKRQLLNLAQNLNLAILKLKKGTYGFCDKCKKNIEKERLEIIPIATHCIACVN